MEEKFLKGCLHKLLIFKGLLIIGDLGGWRYILGQSHCMHLKTVYIRRTIASSSSCFFFILPMYHMLYFSKGVLPEKQDCSPLREWGFSHVRVVLRLSARDNFKDFVIFPNWGQCLCPSVQ